MGPKWLMVVCLLSEVVDRIMGILKPRPLIIVTAIAAIIKYEYKKELLGAALEFFKKVSIFSEELVSPVLDNLSLPAKNIVINFVNNLTISKLQLERVLLLQI